MEIITVIVTIAVAIFGSTGFWTWIIHTRSKKSNETKLIMGIAYRSIIEQAEKHIERGYIEPDEYNELNRYLYEPYRAMGGNGTAEKLMNEVKNLPVRRQG